MIIICIYSYASRVFIFSVPMHRCIRFNKIVCGAIFIQDPRNNECF